LRNRRDVAGFALRVQHARGHRRAGGRPRQGAGDLRLMSELRDLYQQVIIDHSRKPRNFRALAHPTRHAGGVNPLCGDRVTVEVDVTDDTIRDIGFQGSGCAISKASASMMTADLKGKTLAEAEAAFGRFHAMLTDAGSAEEMGKLAVFAGV